MVVIYFFKVLGTGATEKDHRHHLKDVLRLLRLKLQKCIFWDLKRRILGYVIDKDGLHKAPRRLRPLFGRLSQMIDASFKTILA